METVEQDEAHAPLIASEYSITSDEQEPLSASKTIRESATSPSPFIWALTLTASTSGLLFGYDTGVISSTLVSIGPSSLGHSLSALDKGLITSCTSLGALIASPITGLLCDKYGRKIVILAADASFVVGAIWQAVTGSVQGMVAGRTVVGLAVGAASLVVPLYIGELAPSAFRGKLVTVSILFVTLGQVVAYLIGWMLSQRDEGWRWMVGLGGAPAVLQCVLMVAMPETPRWLVKAGRWAEAKEVLQKVYGDGGDGAVEEVLNAIRTEILDEDAISDDVSTIVEGNTMNVWMTRIRNRYAELFHVEGNRRALTIACLLQGLQQLCGFVCFNCLTIVS